MVFISCVENRNKMCVVLRLAAVACFVFLNFWNGSFFMVLISSQHWYELFLFGLMSIFIINQIILSHVKQMNLDGKPVPHVWACKDLLKIIFGCYWNWQSHEDTHEWTRFWWLVCINLSRTVWGRLVICEPWHWAHIAECMRLRLDLINSTPRNSLVSLSHTRYEPDTAALQKSCHLIHSTRREPDLANC